MHRELAKIFPSVIGEYCEHKEATGYESGCLARDKFLPTRNFRSSRCKSEVFCEIRFFLMKLPSQKLRNTLKMWKIELLSSRVFVLFCFVLFCLFRFLSGVKCYFLELEKQTCEHTISKKIHTCTCTVQQTQKGSEYIINRKFDDFSDLRLD